MSFFEVVALGHGRPTLAPGGCVCWARSGLSVVQVLATPCQKCLTFDTTSLGKLRLLFFVFWGSFFYNKKKIKHIQILGRNRSCGGEEGGLNES